MSKGPEEGLLGWLDGPRLVVGAFAFFLCGLTVLGILLWSDQRQQVHRIDQLTEEHIAQQRAANRQTVERCFANANLAPALDRVLKIVERGALTVDEKQAVQDYRLLAVLNSNTRRECRQLAERLDIPIPKGVR